MIVLVFNIIIAIVVAYLIGSIATSVWIGRMFYGIDIRTKGSGNAGATNTIRVLGFKIGIIVLVIDVLKGWFAVCLAGLFCYSFFTLDQKQNLEIVMALAVVIGHIFPVYIGFRGGKGIASLIGVGIALFPYPLLIVISIFIIVLITTRYVSLGSILGSILFPVIVIFVFKEDVASRIIMALAVGIFVPITHLKNINRLLEGKESRFTISKKK